MLEASDDAAEPFDRTAGHGEGGPGDVGVRPALHGDLRPGRGHPGALGHGLRHLGGPLRVAGPEQHPLTGRGPPDRQSTALGTGPAEDPDPHAASTGRVRAWVRVLLGMVPMVASTPALRPSGERRGGRLGERPEESGPGELSVPCAKVWP